MALIQTELYSKFSAAIPIPFGEWRIALCRALPEPFGIRACCKIIMSIDQLTAAVLALRPEERAALAARIVESIDSQTADIPSAWLDVAERRRDEVLSGAVQTISSDEVSKRVRRHLT